MNSMSGSVRAMLPEAIQAMLPAPVASARVLSPPLKSANRRPDDKGWTPWMAARGEARQGR
jgi:hypothetical protein